MGGMPMSEQKLDSILEKVIDIRERVTRVETILEPLPRKVEAHEHTLQRVKGGMWIISVAWIAVVAWWKSHVSGK